MIFDRLESLGKYFSLHPAIKEILSLIADGQLSSLKDSSHETKRDDLFFSISTYETTKDDKKYEYHKRHADLFIMLKGKERCDYSLDSTDLTSIEFEKSDIAFSDAKRSGTVFLDDRCFVIFMPGELHKPGLAAQKEEEVRKAVFKLSFP